MSLIGKKILVIGGNGYVGNYFASRLVKQSATVFAMSRYISHEIGRGSNMISPKIRKSNG